MASCKSPQSLGGTDMKVKCHHIRTNALQMHGFTLVEVLVALVVMSLMALLSWQGIDGMAKATAQHRARSDDVAAVQTALLQWRTDLDHMIDASQTPPVTSASSSGGSIASAVEFDGRVLRITRRFVGDELRVIAWGSRRVETATGSSRRFLRWVSEPIRTRGQWQAAWDQAARWGQNPSAEDRLRETGVINIDDWQLFYYRNNTWSNPLSSSGTNTPSSANPTGVRLILQLSYGQQPSGQLSIDWGSPIT
jgi:general secretion pathway protein J